MERGEQLAPSGRSSKVGWAVGAAVVVLVLGVGLGGFVVARGGGGGLTEDGMYGIAWGTAESEAVPALIDRLGTVSGTDAPECVYGDGWREDYIWEKRVDGKDIVMRAIFVRDQLAAWDIEGETPDDKPSPVWPGMSESELREVANNDLRFEGSLFEFGDTDFFPYPDEIIQGLLAPSSSGSDRTVEWVRVLGGFRPDFLYAACLPVM
jgi:hypothetical protein